MDSIKLVAEPARETSTDIFVANEVARLRTGFVNIYALGTQERWVLVDAGLPGYAGKIIEFAEGLFGQGTKPQAIVLTHGHFDHVGALESLLGKWDVPVYFHTLEAPYLTGLSSYPPPDPAIGGGAISYLSWLFPIKPLELKSRVIEVREGSFIPDIPEWKIIHTPGHSPGHISLFRESDGVLIAGDAFVTVNQNALNAVIEQRKEIHGPPAYFTCDWEAAKNSVLKLKMLEPSIAATGHGIPMYGEELKQGLELLVSNFEALSIPSHGRYVGNPAITNNKGIVEMPAPVSFYAARIAAGALISIAVFVAVKRVIGKNK